MILPQQKTFHFKYGTAPEVMDKEVNKWCEERMKKQEHVSPSGPSVAFNNEGDILLVYVFAKNTK